MYAATKWNHADDVEIEDGKMYLVMTNARDHGDANEVQAMRGRWLRHISRPEMVRGRPVWVATINDPPNFGDPK